MANNALPVSPGVLTANSWYYAVLANSAGLYYRNDGGAPEAFNSAHWSFYYAGLAQASAGGSWAFVFPSNCPNGTWTVQPYLRAGGSPAFGDLVALGAQDATWYNGALVEPGNVSVEINPI
jgi:hypothetical protein